MTYVLGWYNEMLFGKLNKHNLIKYQQLFLYAIHACLCSSFVVIDLIRHSSFYIYAGFLFFFLQLFKVCSFFSFLLFSNEPVTRLLSFQPRR